MLQIIVFLTICYSTIPTAIGVVAAKKSPLSCETVKTYFETQGFVTSDVPKEPISSKELRICGGISSGGLVCCTPAMENRLQSKAKDKHDKALKQTLLRLQNILHTGTIKFHDFFNNLLKTSKRSFHEMFKKTYGILYEQNANVFIDLFQELETYYTKGLGNLDEIMDTFFNTLYQKMFTVLNSQYKFDNKYLECVGQHMKEMKPFGDIPQKLGVQIKRSFIATRAFSQALQVSSEVLKKMQQLKATNECSTALTRMTFCPSCSGVDSNVLACNNMCENVMKGCLTQHAALDSDWNQFVEAVDKVAERLLGPFNIELLVQPINYKISEAIMNFQENSNDVSQRVFAGCGRPVLGRRKRSENNDEKNLNNLRFLNLYEELGASREKVDENDEEKSDGDKHKKQTSSVIILDDLVKEIKQRIRDSRQFWLYLPYKLCNEGLVVPPSNTHDCWNGTHVDKYIYPVSSSGETQILNPEVHFLGSRSAIVNEQISALKSISERLRSAFSGHDVDWVDTEDTWLSGSGSGSNSLDSTEITDDEDGFSEGSGYETTTESAIISEKRPIESKASDEDSLQPPTTIVITGDKVDRNRNININSIIDGRHNFNITQIQPNSGVSLSLQRKPYLKNFTPFFYLVVVVWVHGLLTK